MMKQPNSLHCFICGLENPYGLQLKFYETGPGEITADCTIPDRYQGYPGVVHGGIVAAMLDETAARSQMGGFPPRFMFTARLDLRYRKNVPVDQPLHLVGKAGKTKGRTATATGMIYDQQGVLLAEAEALLVKVPDELVSATDIEALGWKVYPDEEQEKL